MGVRIQRGLLWPVHPLPGPICPIPPSPAPKIPSPSPSHPTTTFSYPLHQPAPARASIPPPAPGNRVGLQVSLANSWVNVNKLYSTFATLESWSLDYSIKECTCGYRYGLLNHTGKTWYVLINFFPAMTYTVQFPPHIGQPCPFQPPNTSVPACPLANAPKPPIWLRDPATLWPLTWGGTEGVMEPNEQFGGLIYLPGMPHHMDLHD